MNNLATIQKIESLRPIINADAIECVKVLGWDVVIKKGEFEEGDLCIYIETDTLIPRKEWSEFLFKNPPNTLNIKEYHRLTTIKLRGQISQGLVLPLSIIPHSTKSWNGKYYINGIDDADTALIYVGYDVTDLLGIKKYEKYVPQLNPKSGMQPKGIFPEFLKKTDEVNGQSYPILLEKLKGKPYYITLKMDGTSATFFKHKGKFGVCSRKMELKNPLEKTLRERIKYFFNRLFKPNFKDGTKKFNLDVYWRMAEKYEIKDWLPEGYAIQGEICGPSIQDNKMGLKENELFIFNVIDINKQELLHYDLFSHFCWDRKFPIVPILHVYDGEFNSTMDELIELANNTNYANGTPAEGIVVRSLDQTISFKVKSNKFLLKYGE